jgi:exopolysaccharide production protein ExoQ
MAEQAGADNERTGLSFRSRTKPSSAAQNRSAVLSAFEHGFVVFSVAVLCGVSSLGRTVAASSIGTTEHNTLNTVLYCLVLLIGALLVLYHRREMVPILINTKVVWLFMAWAVVSVAWSVDPDLAVRRLIQFAAPVLVALYAAARFDPSTAIKLTGWCYFGVVVTSALVSVVWPDLGQMKDNAINIDMVEGSRLAGDWQGILGHKNGLGFVTLGSAQVFIWRWLVEKDRRWLFGGIILFGVFVTYKSHSTTSLLLVGLSLGMFIIIRMSEAAPRLRALIVFVAVIAVVIGILMVTTMRQEMTALVGKDATLTGRLPIWEVLVTHSIPARPLLGYGFNTYFTPSNPEYLRLVEIVDWPAPHAHNGYLNLAVELGIPGALLGVFILLRMIAGAMRRLHDQSAPWAEFMFVFGAVSLVLNCVEATVLRLGDDLTFVLLFSSFALAKHAAKSRAQPKPATPRRANMFLPRNPTEAS